MSRDTYAVDGPSPAVAERAADARFGGDFNTLLAVYRSRIGAQRVTPAVVAKHLRELADLITADESVMPSAGFPQQCFDEWGPGILLRALAHAYERPQQLLVDDVEHP